jgi:hypothetical protein
VPIRSPDPYRITDYFENFERVKLQANTVDSSDLIVLTRKKAPILPASVALSAQTESLKKITDTLSNRFSRLHYKHNQHPAARNPTINNQERSTHEQETTTNAATRLIRSHYNTQWLNQRPHRTLAKPSSPPLPPHTSISASPSQLTTGPR